MNMFKSRKGVVIHAFSDSSGFVLYDTLNGDSVFLEASGVTISESTDDTIFCDELPEVERLVKQGWLTRFDA